MIAPFTQEHMKHIDQMTFEAKTAYCNHIVKEYLKMKCQHRGYRIEELAMKTFPPDSEIDQARFIMVCDMCEVIVEPIGLRPRV